jgi:drug/metabolite transporter (DMT)-like permease
LFLLVLLAAIMHAGWNALVKVSDDRVAAMCGVTIAGGLGGLALLPFAETPAVASWPYLALTTIIHIGYYGFLITAYREGDLSQVYPIARGGSPLLLAVLSAPVLGEPLRATQLVGVLVISLGIASLAFGRGSRKALFYAFGTAAFIAAYSATDALGVRLAGDALGYIAWLFIIDGMMMAAFAAARGGRAFIAFSRANWRQVGGGAALAVAAYGIVVWAYSLGTVAPISALRETSVVFAAIIGSVFLGEPFGARRIIAASVVAAGIVTINV